MKKGTPETMLVNDTVFEILLKDYTRLAPDSQKIIERLSLSGMIHELLGL